MHQWLSATLLATPSTAQPQAHAQPSTPHPGQFPSGHNPDPTSHQVPSPVNAAVSVPVALAGSSAADTSPHEPSALSTPMSRGAPFVDVDAAAPAQTPAASSRCGQWSCNGTDAHPCSVVAKAPSFTTVSRALIALLGESAIYATETETSSLEGCLSVKELDMAGVSRSRISQRHLVIWFKRNAPGNVREHGILLHVYTSCFAATVP